MNRAGKMNNDHLTAPMLSAAMDEVIRLRIRVEALEAALREIEDCLDYVEDKGVVWKIARAALDKEC
jgi:hypothetical protein